MRWVFKVFFWVAGLFLGLVAVVVLAGAFLPREHRVGRRLRLKAAPDKVWALVSKHGKDPLWRKDVVETLRLGDRDGHPVWQDEYQNGQKIAFESLEQVEGQRLVRRIVDPRHFGGTWTYVLRPEGGGTLLEITEEGWVSLPLRAAARYAFGYGTTLELYLRDVAAHFKEGAQPEPI